MYTEADALVKEAENILPQIDRIFLSGYDAVSPEEAAKLIERGEKLLERLKRVEESGMRVTNAIELLGTAINLAKAEVDDDEK